MMGATAAHTLKKYAQADWTKAKEQAREALIKRARVRGQITYSDLTKKVSAIVFNPSDVDFGRLLGELSEDSWAEGEYMISAIVVHKYGDQEPGKGFYDFASSLGLDTRDRLRCWIEEVKKTHAAWAP